MICRREVSMRGVSAVGNVAETPPRVRFSGFSPRATVIKNLKYTSWS